MKKKIISLCLVVCLAAIAVIGGTLAYFTDSEAVANAMTMGKVDINITEVDRDGETLDKTAHPVLPSTWVTAEEGGSIKGEEYSVGNAANVVDKVVEINNESDSSEAYIRAVILFEVPASVKDDSKDAQTSTYGWDFFWNKVVFWKWSQTPSDMSYMTGQTVEIAGTTYAVATFTSRNTIAPGKTYVPMTSFCLDSKVTSSEAEALGATYDILVLGQAVQVSGNENTTPAAALNAAFGEVNSTNVLKWFTAAE